MMELYPWPYGWCQLRDPAGTGQAGSGPNANNDCGPECCSEVIYYLTAVETSAAYLCDRVKGPDYVGYTSLDDLQQILATVAHTRTGIVQAASKQDWLYRIWKSLTQKRPMIGLFAFSTPGADDGHFRAITGLTPRQVITSDPWTGTRRVETYDANWSWSKGAMLQINRRRLTDEEGLLP
jgi:hypothetical protein